LPTVCKPYNASNATVSKIMKKLRLVHLSIIPSQSGHSSAHQNMLPMCHVVC
jgi:hypothetical protein